MLLIGMLDDKSTLPPLQDRCMKTLEIAFTQHRGKINRQQQDCMLVNDTIY